MLPDDRRFIDAKAVRESYINQFGVKVPAIDPLPRKRAAGKEMRMPKLCDNINLHMTNHFLKESVQAKFLIMGTVLLLVFHALILWIISFKTFNMFDMGAFLDASWRVYRGQAPYKDFLFLTGPFHLYLNAFFFQIFGFSKYAIWMHQVVIGSVVILVTMWMVRPFLPAFIVWIVGLVSACSFYIPYGHPWYDPSAHIVPILVLAYLVRNIANERKMIWAAFFSGIAAVISFLTKTNVGGMYAALFLTYWFFGGKPKFFVGCLFGLLVGYITLIHFMPNKDLYIEQAIVSYGGQRTDRLKLLMNMGLWFPKSYVLITILVCIGSYERILKRWKLFFVLVLLCLGSNFVIHTSSSGAANTPLRGIIIGVGLLLLYSYAPFANKYSSWLNKTAIGLLLLLAVLFSYKSFLVGYTRYVWLYSGHKMGDYALKSGKFKGWRFETKDGVFLERAIAYYTHFAKPNDVVLAFNPFYIFYGMAGIESYKKIPFIIHDFAMGKKDIRKYYEEFKRNPPDWVLAKVDDDGKLIMENERIPGYFREQYLPVVIYDHAALLRKIQHHETRTGPSL